MDAYTIGLVFLALALINKIITALSLTITSVVVVAGVVIAIFVNEKEKREMEKKIAAILLVLTMVIMTMVGCSEAERVSYNLSEEADNFNIVRQLTVINCIEGDVLFQMTGKLSITADTTDNQLEIIVEDGGTYVKHFIGLSDNVTYVVEDLNLGDNEVSKYKYTLNFNPNMWIPVEADVID